MIFDPDYVFEEDIWSRTYIQNNSWSAGDDGLGGSVKNVGLTMIRKT